jgi:hypothetical protein
VVSDLGLGQLTTALFALLAGAQLVLGRGRGSVACGLLGLALLLKRIAWPWILPLLWRRAWSTLGVAFVVVLIGFGVPALRFGNGTGSATWRVLVIIPAAHLSRWLHIHHFPRLPTMLAGAVAIALYLTGSNWRDVARLVNTLLTGPVPVVGLLTLGPGLAAGALGLLLAGLSRKDRSECL